MWDRDLSQSARTVYLDPETELYLSAASYWEICIKASIGKLGLKEGWIKRFDEEMVSNTIRWLAIDKTHCQRVVDLPFLHQDPFDRLLIAQALCEGMTLLTADGQIQQYAVSTLW